MPGQPQLPAMASAESASPPGPPNQARAALMFGCSSRSLRNVSRWPWPRSAISASSVNSPEVLRMAPGQASSSPGRDQLFSGVLPKRLQHPVTGGRRRFDDDHGALHQPADGVEHLPRPHGVVADHVLRRGQGASALEDRQPVEDPLLRPGEQGVAPVDRGSQGLLPGLGRPRPGRQEREAVGQPVRDLERRHGGDPGRGQLERQRDAVERAADPSHGEQVVLAVHRARTDGAGPFDEELGCRVLQHLSTPGCPRERSRAVRPSPAPRRGRPAPRGSSRGRSRQDTDRASRR